MLKTLHFENYECLCQHIIDTYNELVCDNIADCSVGVIVKGWELDLVLPKLLDNDFYINAINIDLSDNDNEEIEYCIRMYGNGAFACEPIKVYDFYAYVENTVTFISEEINSKCLKYIISPNKVVFSVGECECDCENCCCTTDNQYMINGKPVSKEEYDIKLCSEFNKFQKEIWEAYKLF